MEAPRNDATRPLYEHLDRILFDEQEIRSRLAEMGEQITREYEDRRQLTIVTILQGGVVFLADLIREIHLPLKVDSISVASYHGGTESSGVITFNENRLPDLKDRHVIVLDDILDTGRTMHAITKRFREECSPLSVKTCVLLSKNVERAKAIEADYFGFEVENEFVVGYGLDYNGEYRNLPEIGVLKPEFYTH